MEIGFRVSIVCGIPYSLSWIADSNAQDSGFHLHWKISWILENPDYLRSFNLPPITSTNCLGGVNDTLTVFFENFKRTTFNKDVLGTDHYLSPGAGAEDLGINKVKFSRSSLWMLLHVSDPPPPPNNIWRLSSFSKQIWVVPPSESFQSFQWSPSSAFSVTTDPPFCSPKIKWSRPKSSPRWWIITGP